MTKYVHKPTMAIDRAGTVMRMNPAFLELTGKESEECLGRKCFEVLGLDGCEKCGYDCKAIMANGRVKRIRNFSLPAENRIAFHVAMAAPLRDRMGCIHGVLLKILLPGQPEQNKYALKEMPK